jgi:hypothetical protein
VCVRVSVVCSLPRGGHGEEGVGVQGDRGPALPEGPVVMWPLSSLGTWFPRLVVFPNGLITSGKFCWVRRVRRPPDLRRSALHAGVSLVAGEHDDQDLDRLQPVQPAPGRRAPVGSGLPAAGTSGRVRRPACLTLMAEEDADAEFGRRSRDPAWM